MARKAAGDWRNPEHVAEWVHVICRQTRVAATIPAQRHAEPAAAPATVKNLTAPALHAASKGLTLRDAPRRAIVRAHKILIRRFWWRPGGSVRLLGKGVVTNW